LNRGGDPELDAGSEMAAAAVLIRNGATLSTRDLADDNYDLGRASGISQGGVKGD
jgi:hypothetical protein